MSLVSVSASSSSSSENSRETDVNTRKMTQEDERRKISALQEDGPERHVLVLYVGGTIGMVRNDEGSLIPLPNAFVENVRRYPQLHDYQYSMKRFGSLGPLVLPMTATDKYRVIYKVSEYSNLCDSSNMTMNDWISIANDIKACYECYNGFVILQGTDTLSYTASALSFMLVALGKPVILTGSQVPIFDTRSDGLDNFLSSLVIAANYNIPEVCVFFGTKLMRGNRTSKASSSSFDAFHSPNFPPLATAHAKIEVDYRSIFYPCTLDKFHVHTNLNGNVGLLRLFPGITSYLVKAFLQPPIQGVVLQSYGAGNIPTNREDIIAELSAATTLDVIIVNITQCTTGCISNAYAGGKLLQKAGVISGFDMTPEAALTKLAYVLSRSDWDINVKRRMMETNLRGELTVGRLRALQDLDLVEAVARSLKISSSVEHDELGSILFPAMLSTAVIKRDIAKLESLKQHGASVSQTNTDGRTALHVACCEGSVEIVQSLLMMGGNVHVKDRFNRTPLIDAIENDHHRIINMLIQCGAHLQGNTLLTGERMCAAAAAGNTKRLQSYLLARANVSQMDSSGRTPLHFAVLHHRAEMIKFLLRHGADPRCTDMLGQSALDIVDIMRAMDAASSKKNERGIEESKRELLTKLDL